MGRKERAAAEARVEQSRELGVDEIREEQDELDTWVEPHRVRALVGLEESLESGGQNDVGDPESGETEQSQESEEEVGREGSENELSEEKSRLKDAEEGHEIGESEGGAEENFGIEGEEETEENEGEHNVERERVGAGATEKQMGAQTGGAVEGVDGAAHALRSALLALTGLLDWEEVGRT